MNDKIEIILIAGFGGAAPSLVNMAKDLSEDISPSFLFVTAIILYFGLGCAVARIFQETDRKKSFFLGVSLPALIVTAAAREPVMPNDQIGWLFAPFEITAYAQDVDALGQLEAAGKKLLYVDPSTNSGDFSVYYFGKNGAPIGQGYKVPDKSGVLKFIVPEDAYKYGVFGSQANPSFGVIPEGHDFGITVERDRNYLNDFWRGLGNRSIQPYDFSVSPNQEMVPGLN